MSERQAMQELIERLREADLWLASVSLAKHQPRYMKHTAQSERTWVRETLRDAIRALEGRAPAPAPENEQP